MIVDQHMNTIHQNRETVEVKHSFPHKVYEKISTIVNIDIHAVYTYNTL